MVKLSQEAWNSAAVTSLFEPSFLALIKEQIVALDWEEAKKSFYRQREKNLTNSPEFSRHFNASFRGELSKKVSLFFGKQIGSDFDISAHKMIQGDFIDAHTDENSYGETHRLTVTLNDDWPVAAGGILLTLKSGSIKDVRDAWLPNFNCGLLFEISQHSFHAVTPVAGNQTRYSLIFTFRQSSTTSEPSQIWVPFPLVHDMNCAKKTGGAMGINPDVLSGNYAFHLFDSTREFASFLASSLENSPDEWTYRHGKSMNVDEDGMQPKGSDAERVAAIATLKRVPPILVVQRRNGSYVLVDGSHRLAHAQDNATPLGVAIFQE